MDMLNPDDVLLNQRQAAHLLGLQESTLERWRWARIGLPYVKCGRLVKYKQSTILKYLNDRTVEVDPTI